METTPTTYTVTINVATMGHPKTDGTVSSSGHMWITLSDGTSMGYGLEGVTGDDDAIYEPNGLRKIAVTLTEAQYNKLLHFRDNPAEFGFEAGRYVPVMNDCIDYVWKALIFTDLVNPIGYVLYESLILRQPFNSFPKE